MGRKDNRSVATPAFLRDRRVLLGLVIGTGLLLWLTIGSTGPASTGLRPGQSGVYQPGPPMPLNTPYGGRLINLVAPPSEAATLLAEAGSHTSLTLTSRQLCDIELLMSGGFSPLDSFMTQDVYNSVVENMRLGPKYGNAVFPMPITLDVSESFGDSVSLGDKLTLRDEFYNVIGILTVTDKWRPDKRREAEYVLGTTDDSHPAVDYLFHTAGSVYLGGSIQGVRLPQHFDFPEDRKTPAQVRAMLKQRGWSKVVGFQTRNPMHRAHIELTRLATTRLGAAVLIHPVVGMTKPGDVDYSVRVRCYRAVVASGRYYQEGGVALALLPLAMRMAGPREALWHAIIRKNHGASHFIVGRDHAGCKSASGEDFYGAYDAQTLVLKHAKEIGIEIATYQMVKYLPDEGVYRPLDEIPSGAKTLALSGTEFRKMMASGEEIPEWFSDPDVIKILREVSPPRVKRGFAVLFTGLSGSGKTTISHALIQKLQSVLPTRHLTILDGDVVRTHLSKGLGFTAPDRNANVERIGFVAAEVAKHGGIAICSPIAPFEKARGITRKLIEATGAGFLTVHVSTSVEVCAARDVKGLYNQALNGELAFTGVSAPYENPDEAEITIDAGVVPVETSVQYIIGWLVKEGYIDPSVVAPAERGNSLATSGVVTTGVLDLPAKQCPRQRRFTKFRIPQIVYSLAGPADAQMLLNALSSRADTLSRNLGGAVKRRVISAAEFAKWESEIAGADAASRGGDISGSYDPDYATGTTPTSAVSDDWAVEVGWALWVASRGEGENEAVSRHSENIHLVSGPRAIRYLPYVLRIDPCARVAAVGLGDPKKDAAAQLSAFVRATGASDADAQEYLLQFYTEIYALAARYPSRVFVQSAGHVVASDVFNSISA